MDTLTGAGAALLDAWPRMRRKARAVAATMARDLGANELAQEGALAFLEAWSRADRNPSAYALAAAEGAMRERVRREGRALTFDHAPDADGRPDLPRRVRRAVRSLRRSYREVMLPWLSREPTAATAMRLGVTENAVRVRRHKALVMLHAKFHPAPRARRRPGGRPAKHDWPAARAAIARGEPASAVASRMGTTLGTLRSQFRRYGWAL